MNQLMTWKGHEAVGDRIFHDNRDTFILWTKCGSHDIPANSAVYGGEVTCEQCKVTTGQ